MEHVEAETEVHRTQKAVKELLGRLDARSNVKFPDSTVSIHISPDVARTPGGQFALCLLINLLTRMKSIVTVVSIKLPHGIAKHQAVHLGGEDLRDSLETMIAGVSGPESEYEVEFLFDGTVHEPTVSLAIGREGLFDDVEILIEADPWAAYINQPGAQSRWNKVIPFGPMAGASLGVAEIFKQLLIKNYPDQGSRKIKFLNCLSFSLLDYGVARKPVHLPAEEGIELKNMAIAGLGAGGSAVVYVLSSIPSLRGKITLVDPGDHKKSNLGRYLLSRYADCYEQTSKVDRAAAVLDARNANLEVIAHQSYYEDLVERDYEIVVSTTDTPEARWNLQRDWPSVILDAGVIGTIYSIARITPNGGMCLGCKHPYDPDVTMKRIARKWGIPFEEFTKLVHGGTPVTQTHISQLAKVQGREPQDYEEFRGISFMDVPSWSDCGEARFNLVAPNQVASLPFVTTMAGVLLAVEVIKGLIMPEMVVSNWFEHDMFWVPKPSRHRFRNRYPRCHICGNLR